MKYKDYYKILDLETNRISVEEIKSAYRAAAKKYHPDLNIGDVLAEERIKDINEAYRVLSEPVSKKKYDKIWKTKNNIKNYQNFNGKNLVSMFLGNVELMEKEEQVKVPQRGEDIETEISVSIEDAFFGNDKKISLKNVEGSVKNFSIKIPAGIFDGEKIRLVGQGKEGINGGKNGDLFIKINLEKSTEFKIRGNELCTDLKLTPWEAALGDSVTFNSIDGEVKVYVPRGIQSGEKLRIPGKGYIDKDGNRGDLVAEVKIVVPRLLDENEYEIYEKMKEVSSFNPRSEKRDLHKDVDKI